jgi:hypothetical protein
LSLDCLAFDPQKCSKTWIELHGLEKDLLQRTIVFIVSNIFKKFLYRSYNSDEMSRLRADAKYKISMPYSLIVKKIILFFNC